MLRFLLKNGLDPNVIELDLNDWLAPISMMVSDIVAELVLSKSEDKEIFDQITECYRLVAEAGADFGIGDIESDSGFESILVGESSATLKYVIYLGEPFVYPDMLVRESGSLRHVMKFSPLLYLADIYGYVFLENTYVLEKAIIFLKWGVEVSCQDFEGNTVLHKVLSCSRKYWAENHRPEEEPGELLKVFIAAGADVYALNKAGRSASRVAWNFGREKEWAQALEFCGFNSKEVMNQTMPKHIPYNGPRQTSGLTFEEYYRTWDEKKWAEKMGRFSEVNSEEEENWEEGEDWEEEDENEDGSEDDSEEGDKSGVEKRLWERCCTHEATTVAPRNNDGDGDDPKGNLASDHEELRDEDHAEYGDVTGEDMLAATDHVNSFEMGTTNAFGGIDHDGNNAFGTAIWQPYDPMLNEEETESANGSWRYDAMDCRGNLDQTSLAEGDCFNVIGATLEGTCQTDFNNFMTFE